MRRAAAIAALIAASLPLAPGHAANFSEQGPLASDTGQVSIQWRSDGPVELTIAGTGAEPRPIFRGDGEELFVSGLGDGEFTVFLRDESGALADTITLEVVHQSLTQALWLAALGALVFLLTVGAILRGARDG